MEKKWSGTLPTPGRVREGRPSGISEPVSTTTISPPSPATDSRQRTNEFSSLRTIRAMVKVVVIIGNRILSLSKRAAPLFRFFVYT